MGQPNILLITTDQHRFDALRCMGNPSIDTPNLDRLAEGGALFRGCASSSPICVPARLSIVSGEMPGRLGCIGNGGTRQRPAQTIPSLLNPLGYHTQAIGKMHFVPWTEDHGFQDMCLSEEMRWVRTPSFHKEGKPHLDDYDRYLHARGLWGWEKPPETGYNEIKPTFNGLPIEHHVTTWCGDRCVEYLNAPRKAPFFLWASFTKPHVPYDAPQGMEEYYDPDALPGPLRREGELADKFPGFPSYRRANEWHLYSDEAARLAKAHYYANITLIDRQVGRMLDALESSGHAGNTLVIFTSDHGDQIGDHWLWFKSTGYESSLRVPLIVRFPDHVQPSTGSDAPASLVDILPTAVCAAGTETPESLPGRDLCALANASDQGREFVAAEIGHLGGACQYLRSKTHKYIHYQNGGHEELYDLESDPQEFCNLATSGSHEALRARCRRQLAEFLQSYSSPEIHLVDGDLSDKPYAEPPSRAGHRPYSRMPWDLRRPPSVIDEKERGWWWSRHPNDDFTRFLDSLDS